MVSTPATVEFRDGSDAKVVLAVRMNGELYELATRCPPCSAEVRGQLPEDGHGNETRR